jgi:hypothetical protein
MCSGLKELMKPPLPTVLHTEHAWATQWALYLKFFKPLHVSPFYILYLVLQVIDILQDIGTNHCINDAQTYLQT